MGKGHILKATDFTYPTRQELTKLRKDSPSISGFGFPYIHEMSALFKKMPMDIVVRESLLHWWDTCLTNRLGSLSQAYENAMVNYDRGLPRHEIDWTKKETVNRIQFDFYGEVYCYYFHVVKEIIAQILNTYSDLDLKENQISLFNVKNKLVSFNRDLALVQIITAFLNDTKELKTIRDSFTHRFPVNFPDFRPSLETRDNRRFFGSGTEYELSSENFASLIMKSYRTLDKFVISLKETLLVQ